MRLLLATTAMSFALGAANFAVASVSFLPADTVDPLEIILAPNFETPVSLTAETETFYCGDFQAESNAKLEGLTHECLYKGNGAVEMITSRWVT